MAMALDSYGPQCNQCGGASSRGVRTRQLGAAAGAALLASGSQPMAKSDAVYYLAYEWVCSVCGHRWVDAGLESLNACAAEGARSMARRAS